MVVIAIVCLAGCGENSDQREARKTVDDFYVALKRHDAKAACGLISPAVASAMTESLGENRRSCVAALDDVFGKVERSASPGFFDSLPSVKAVTVRGDRAIVILARGYQRRRVGLTRVSGGWQITDAPNARLSP